MNTLFFSWLLVIVAALMDVIGIFIVKNKLNILGPVNFNNFESIFNYIIQILKFPIIWLAILLILISPVPYALALSRLNLSITYPVIVGMSCLLTLSLGIFYLNENLNIFQIIGILLIIFGIILVYQKSI